MTHTQNPSEEKKNAMTTPVPLHLHGVTKAYRGRTVLGPIDLARKAGRVDGRIGESARNLAFINYALLFSAIFFAGVPALIAAITAVIDPFTPK